MLLFFVNSHVKPAEKISSNDKTCGKLILETNDDNSVSESAFTEMSCFTESVVQDGLNQDGADKVVTFQY